MHNYKFYQNTASWVSNYVVQWYRSVQLLFSSFTYETPGNMEVSWTQEVRSKVEVTSSFEDGFWEGSSLQEGRWLTWTELAPPNKTARRTETEWNFVLLVTELLFPALFPRFIGEFRPTTNRVGRKESLARHCRPEMGHWTTLSRLSHSPQGIGPDPSDSHPTLAYKIRMQREVGDLLQT